MKDKILKMLNTPKEYYWWIVEHCGYFDPCPANHTFDGLSIDWPKNVFCNPPYSEIDKWVDKAILEHQKQYDSDILLLVPARTDTKWFCKLLSHACHVKFIEGRLHFNDSKGSAPFPSILVELYYGSQNCSCWSESLDRYKEYYKKYHNV